MTIAAAPLQSDAAAPGLHDRVRGAAIRTIAIERAALQHLGDAVADDALGAALQQAVELVAASAGRVVVTGMGKSGLIGRKVSATLASTGTPAFYLHPAEAGHGDLGMITPADIVLALSWSGETGELSDVLAYCGRLAIPVVAMTSRPDSTLGRCAAICLTLPDVEEACPHRLAPTSSTTIQAALGDALAIALLEFRGFSVDDFRRFHPKGNLGVQLLRIGDVMAVGAQLPKVAADASILDAMMEMSAKRYGATAIVDDDDALVGAFTDGDLRRGLMIAHVGAAVRDHMTLSPLVSDPHLLASEALALMNARNISQLFVCQTGRLVGVVHLHDLLRVGVA